MSEDLNFSESQDSETRTINADVHDGVVLDHQTTAPAPIETTHAMTTAALDKALTDLRLQHIDSSTSEGLAVLRLRDGVLAVLHELRDLVKPQ